MKRWLLAASLLVSLLALAIPAGAYADVNDFTVTDFTADYILTRDDPQGTLSVEERLDIDFTDANHGILRAIPLRYDGQDQRLRIVQVQRDGQNEPYTTYTSNDNEVLKIGSAERTITGPHTYQIFYQANDIIRFDSKSDQLIWNTNGTQWKQPFLSEKVRLHIPAEIAGGISDVRCYTGAQGSTAHDCTATQDDNTITYVSTRPLYAGETMTIAVDFPVGTFRAPTTTDRWREHIGTVVAILLPVVLAFAIAYPKWRRDGKDLKGRGTIVPEYAPPDNLRAAEAEAVLNYTASNKGISATIIDLAIRKHLKIVEGVSDGIFGIGKHKVYSFEKLESALTDLNEYEATLYKGLFKKGSVVKTDDLKDSYYTEVATAQAQIQKRLEEDGYVPKGQKLKGWWIWLLAALWFTCGILFHTTASVGFVLGSIVFVGFGLLMSKRTQKGQDAKDALEGLRLYMDTAEKDRLKMLQSTDAPYAGRSTEPVKTVELFEKLLPFAIVLGVEGSWAKQFESIYATPPDWYAGNWTAFNALYLASSLGDSVSAMNTSFAAPSSSSSGSGGSFSGGGAGGGGGGGW